MGFRKTIITSVGLIFISFSFVAKCSQLKNLNNYSVMLCGKVSNNILDDIGGYKERNHINAASYKKNHNNDNRKYYIFLFLSIDCG